MTQEELLRLIDEAAADGRPTLDLAGENLSELPPEIGKLTNLKTLVLGRWDKKQGSLGNNLSALPDEIGLLQELRSLFLYGNQFIELPEAVAKLSKLRSLSLQDNQLTTLPDWLAELTELRSLNLSGNQLSSLPEFIGQLTNLTSLSLSGNQLSSLPEFIGQLTNLTSLNLWDNQLSSLPEVVGQLTNLTSLNLWDNQLSSLPEFIGQLTNLTSLNLSFNQLSSLPEFIGQLTNLTLLDLRSNQLSSLLEFIGQLTNLTSLNLRSNQLSSLPEVVGQLSNLTSLDISRSQLSSLPEVIGQLTNLTSLKLDDNQVVSLSPVIKHLLNLKVLSLGGNWLEDLPVEVSSLSQLKYLSLGSMQFVGEDYCQFNVLKGLGASKQGNRFKHIPECVFALPNLKVLDLSFNQLSTLTSEIQNQKNLKKLDLRGNPLPIPPEILGGKGFLAEPGDITNILSFYFQVQDEEGSVPLYEAKLILIGEGGAGKTSLAKKIESEKYKLAEDEKSTEGIDVIRWDFSLADGTPFRTNIWDFGGQEIYHATHQFFLTKRSLYFLVADIRQENTDFYYWLKIVELLSDSSPVLIVKNEKQDRQCEIDEGLFKSQFNNLKDSIPVNLADNRGLASIKDAIRYHIIQLEHVGKPLPKIWVRVRSALENYAQSCNTITIEKYCDICRQNGFTDKQQMLSLSSYLHDLGVCLHFQDDKLLKSTVILRPDWATTAVYKVTDSDTVRKNKGRFTDADLAEIWSGSQYTDLQDQLLQLMMRFKLAYEIPNAPGSYISPQLLPISKPDYPWNTADNLILRYRYDFMPKGILSRFIVETHQLIERQDHVWKNGVVLADKWARAEIIENYPKNQIHVRVTGSNKKPLLEKVRYELWKIHESYERLDYKELIPCNCPQCKDSTEPESYAYDLLMKYIGDRRYDIECRASYAKVDVRRLISDITDQSTRSDIAHQRRELDPTDDQFWHYLNQRSVLIDRSTHATHITNQYGDGDNIARDKVGRDKIDSQINNQQDLAQLS
ncbi:MAG: COR domain-containing protein, partial [Phormidesmis sp.]